MKEPSIQVEKPESGFLETLRAKLLPIRDADSFYEEAVSSQIDSTVDPKTVGFYQRLNTYLFQLNYYLKQVYKDIQEFLFHQKVYLTIYIFGLIIVPLWLIAMESKHLGLPGIDFVPYLMMVLYGLFITSGVYLIRHQIKKIKLILDSKRILIEQSKVLFKASEDYNIKLLNDNSFGSKIGFDDTFKTEFDLTALIKNDFKTISHSYNRHLVKNKDFDYADISSTIRAHHVYFHPIIKVNGEVPVEYINAITSLHRIHQEKFNTLYQKKGNKK